MRFWGRIFLTIAITGLLLALTACGAPPTATPVPKTAPPIEAQCFDVKSPALNIGNSKGRNICVDGTVTYVNFPNTDKSAGIGLDTGTGRFGASLYTIEVFINNRFEFGVQNIDRVVKGMRIRVHGTFNETYPGKYYVKVEKPDALEIF